jgi:cytochrome b
MRPKAASNLTGRVFVKVWDPVVRIGHWTMVLCFCALFFRSGKFPLHVYAAYIVMAIMVFRIVWGFAGPHAARFWTFMFSPKTMIQYGIDSVAGHPMHTISHNPLGAAMVFALIISMLGTGALGLMLYSAGQEMGPLGDMVPADWENEFTTLTLFGNTFPIGLKELHIWCGNVAAALVTCHVLGTLWATAVHKTAHVIGMISGVKDAMPDDPELKFYKQVAPPRFARNLNEAAGPAMTEIILVTGILVCIAWPVVEFLTWLNQFIPSY